MNGGGMNTSINDNNLESNREAEQAALDAKSHEKIVASFREMIGYPIRRGWLNEKVAHWDMRIILQRAKEEKWPISYADQVCLHYINTKSSRVNRSLLSSCRPSIKKPEFEVFAGNNENNENIHGEFANDMKKDGGEITVATAKKRNRSQDEDDEQPKKKATI